jgi:hypothetical protein
LALNRLGNSLTGLDSLLQLETGLVSLGGAQLASALVDLGSSLPASAPSRSALEAISSSSLALALDVDSVLDCLGGALMGSTPDNLGSLLGLGPNGDLNNLQPATELGCFNSPGPGGTPPNSVFGTVSGLMLVSALTRLLGNSLRCPAPGCLNSEIFIVGNWVMQFVFDNGGEFTITADQLFNVPADQLLNGITTNIHPNPDNKETKLLCMANSATRAPRSQARGRRAGHAAAAAAAGARRAAALEGARERGAVGASDLVG